MRGARAVPSMGNPLGKKTTNTHCDDPSVLSGVRKRNRGGQFLACAKVIGKEKET